MNQSKEQGSGEWKEGDQFTSPETGNKVFTVISVSKYYVDARDGRSASGITSFTKDYITKVTNASPLPENSKKESMGEKIGNCLQEIISEYGFALLEKRAHVEIYSLDCSKSSDCEGLLLVRVLRDNSLRLSITETDDTNLFHAVDLFEFRGFGKIHDFMKLIGYTQTFNH